MLVTEPTVEATIAILRGLKERYEVHHGARIQDAALVAAATLSHRYIADRFLPDKAIDLVDEAVSRLRMELDSMPTEIDQLERQIQQLEIEQSALKREKDEASRERLNKLERDLANLKERATALKAQWQNEESGHQRREPGQQPDRASQTRSGEGAASKRFEPRRPDPIRPAAGTPKETRRSGEGVCATSRRASDCCTRR